MPKLTLYFAPDTCARVPLIALEQIGCEYDLEVIAFMKGEHRSPDYLRLNRSGKVPTLIVDGEPLTENVAINLWLAETYPDAALLPRAEGLARARQLSDLAYCASGLHPIVTRLRIPHMFFALPEAKFDVFANAETAMRMHFAALNDRLDRSRWWYGADWSIIDAYVNWVWLRVSGTDFDTSPYPALARHDRDVQAHPRCPAYAEAERGGRLLPRGARSRRVAQGLATTGQLTGNRRTGIAGPPTTMAWRNGRCRRRARPNGWFARTGAAR